MNDPLADVNPELRKWLTPEMVDAVTAVYRTDFSPRIAFWHMPGGNTVLVGGTTAETGVEYGRVVVDPSKPWPPQPEYKFGDKVTSEEGAGVVLSVDPQLGIFVKYRNGLAGWESSIDLTSGWSDE